ncbi:MAG: hypothetical protein ABIS51_13410 [Sphingomonas sp.]
MLDLFVQHGLTIVAHQPPFDESTRRLAANQGKPRLLAGDANGGNGS